jgi:hypothetical protein
MEPLHQSLYDHEILYAAVYSNGKQLLIRPYFYESQKYEHGWWLFIFGFMDTNLEPLL